MKQNWIHLLIALVFIVFGILQYNDPDFWLWGVIYFITAAIPILYMRYSLPQYITLGYAVILGIYTISYLPDMYDWITGGMPNIASSMKAKSPHIELTREFFGLLLCLSLTIIYFLKSRKNTFQ